MEEKVKKYETLKKEVIKLKKIDNNPYARTLPMDVKIHIILDENFVSDIERAHENAKLFAEKINKRAFNSETSNRDDWVSIHTVKIKKLGSSTQEDFILYYAVTDKKDKTKYEKIKQQNIFIDFISLEALPFLDEFIDFERLIDNAIKNLERLKFFYQEEIDKKGSGGNNMSYGFNPI